MTMQLSEWLELKGLKPADFAKRIKKTPGLVHKYLYEGVIPKPETMRDIYVETLGVVTANDFNGLTPELLKKSLKKGVKGHASTHT